MRSFSQKQRGEHPCTPETKTSAARERTTMRFVTRCLISVGALCTIGCGASADDVHGSATDPAIPPNLTKPWMSACSAAVWRCRAPSTPPRAPAPRDGTPRLTVGAIARCRELHRAGRAGDRARNRDRPPRVHDCRPRRARARRARATNRQSLQLRKRSRRQPLGQLSCAHLRLRAIRGRRQAADGRRMRQYRRSERRRA